jgi:hypothetical protein
MRWLVGTLAALTVMTVVYFGSAYVALSDLVAAAQRADGARLLARTDVPRVTDSIVRQVVGAYFDRLGKGRQPGAAERLVAGAVGGTFADLIAARLLTAEGLSRFLDDGHIEALPDSPEVRGLPRLSDLDPADAGALLARLHLITPVEMSIRIGSGEHDADAAIRLHLDSQGWRLSAITLPRARLDELIARLPARSNR